MTVMIKSWAGEMVPARVGMVVEIKGIIPQRCVVTDVKDGLVWFDSDVLGWPVLQSECTMISCPFAVGDEVEVLICGEWVSKLRNGKPIPYDEGLHDNKYLGGVRHANPNLRTKPEGNV